MKKIVMICLALCMTFLFWNEKQEGFVIKDIADKKVTKSQNHENELKKHVVSNTSINDIKDHTNIVQSIKHKDRYIYVDGVELLDLTHYVPDVKHMYSDDPVLSNMYFCYYSFTRNNDNGIHYDKVYSSYTKALNDAKKIHLLSPYNQYKSYTIEGLDQCGYKIYFVQ